MKLFGFTIWHNPNSKKEKMMEYFSVEYRNRLIDEHKLVSATIAHLKGEVNAVARRHTGEAINAALFNLAAKKVELEGMIDVLKEFLG